MKKILLSSLALVAGFAASAQLPVSATPMEKNAVLEEFTGISCGYCPDGHKISNELAAANPGRFFAINYHVSSYAAPQGPGTDFRTTDGSAIDVAGAPSGYPNGGVNRGTGSGWSVGRGSWGGMVTPILGEDSPANIALEGTVNYTTRELTVDVQVTYPVGAPAGSGSEDYLSVALLQNNVEGPQSNGAAFNPAQVLPNGNYNHMHMFRMFVNDTHPNGDAISTTQGVVVTKQYTMTLPDDIAGVDLNVSQLEVVAFLSEGNNLTSPLVTGAEGEIELILPAGVSEADMSATSSHTAPSSFCTNAFTPKITVTNESSNAIAQYTVSYSVNGGATVTEDITTPLTGGSSYEHVFPAITLANGTNEIVYSSNTDNDPATLDVTSSNNSSIAYAFVVPTAAIGSTFSADFESSANGDAEAANTTHDNAAGIDAYVTSASGYNSSNSFMWNFFGIQSGESSLILHKVDFSASTGNKLSFYKAHAQYQTESDELKVDVSTDCGATWTNVWVKSGSALSTVPAQTGGFIATSAQYEQVIVDLAAYDGESEVMVRFKGTSAYGNRLFLDDININTNIVDNSASIEGNELESNLSVFPNPATINTTVAFNLTEVSNVLINITNTLGQTVYTNNLGTVNGNQNIQINTSDLEAGMYLVNVSVNGVVSTERISIVK